MNRVITSYSGMDPERPQIDKVMQKLIANLQNKLDAKLR